MKFALSASSLALVVYAAACSSSSAGGFGEPVGTDAGGGNDGGGTGADGGGTGTTDGNAGPDVDSGATGTTDGSAGADADSGGGGPTTLTPGTSMINLNVAGHSRTAVLYVPANATSTAPLVIALHGDGDTDTNFIATSGLQTLADTDGFVLVAPQGITRDITVGGQTVPQVDWDAYNSVASGNIDLPLLEQLRTQLQATNQVNPKRTFVFGYSQGGYMSFLYGMTDAPVLSCAGVLAASSPYGGASNDPLIAGATRKIAVAMQIGTLDSAYSAAQTTDATLMAQGFPVQFNAISGAGHVPIPGDISVPLGYCLGQSL